MIESKIPKETEILPIDLARVGRTGELALKKFSALSHRFLDAQISRSCAMFFAASAVLRSVAYQTRYVYGPIRSDWDRGREVSLMMLCYVLMVRWL